MEPLIKNLPHAQPFPLKDQVGYEPGKVVSLTLAQRPGVGMTLFAFDAGEAISTHAAPGDAMATILEGTAQITIDGVPHTLNAGEAVIMRRHPPRGPGRDPIQNVPGGCEGVTLSHPMLCGQTQVGT